MTTELHGESATERMLKRLTSFCACFDEGDGNKNNEEEGKDGNNEKGGDSEVSRASEDYKRQDEAHKKPRCESSQSDSDFEEGDRRRRERRNKPSTDQSRHSDSNLDAGRRARRQSEERDRRRQHARPSSRQSHGHSELQIDLRRAKVYRSKSRDHLILKIPHKVLDKAIDYEAQQYDGRRRHKDTREGRYLRRKVYRENPDRDDNVCREVHEDRHVQSGAIISNAALRERHRSDNDRRRSVSRDKGHKPTADESESPRVCGDQAPERKAGVRIASSHSRQVKAKETKAQEVFLC